jgi:hypothetical protein
MVNKVDSNLTGLRYAEETSIGTLPGSGVVWTPLEPNSYSGFGSTIKTVARNPINASRQRQKGVVTDVDATAGFSSDLTQTNLYDLLQGFFFADWRKKDEDASTAAVDGGVSSDEYTVASGGADYRAGDLIFASGFGLPANNGLKSVAASSTSTAVKVTTGSLAAEATAPAGAKIKRVGYQFASGDATITVTSGVATLGATSKDLTQLGVIPGEWIYIGGDSAGNSFATAANNGFARVKSVAASAIVFDKSQGTMVTDAGTGKTIRLYIGDVLKNEKDPALIKTRSYQLERDLSTAGLEYVVGAVPNQFSVKMSSASKVTVDLSFVGTDTQTVAFGSAKAGTRPDLTTGQKAFNTSADFSRLRFVNSSNADLSTFLMEATLNINNGVTPMKAIGTLGSVDVSLGDFTVSGSVTAYFSSIAAVTAVRNNEDISLDFVLCRDNAGIMFDIPLLGLGNGQVQVEKDQPIKLPLTLDSAEHPTLHHTMLLTHYAYLPSVAEA